MIKERLKETIENLNTLLKDEGAIKAISEAIDIIVNAIKASNKLLICGNGGSAADAQHIAGECLGRFYKDREPIPAIALTTDTSVLTSISNDYSFNDVFSRQVKGLGKEGDVLLGISTSGNSENVMAAFKVAKELKIKTILLTGEKRGKIALFSDIIIHTPSSNTPRIQEMHLLIEHIICEIIEKRCMML